MAVSIKQLLCKHCHNNAKHRITIPTKTLARSNSYSGFIVSITHLRFLLLIVSSKLKILARTDRETFMTQPDLFNLCRGLLAKGL